jgi:type II secretory pathway pseudopilin PulG
MKTLLRVSGAGDRKSPAAGESFYIPAEDNENRKWHIAGKAGSVFGSNHRRAGFSILEMLVVLNIMAWMTWVSITSLWEISGGMAMNRKVSDMQSILELARSQAMQLNTYVYVGFFESDGTQPAGMLPVRTGVGKIWVGTVATKDGTPGYDPTDPSSTLNPNNLMPIGKLQQMENLHINQSLPFSNTAILTNSVLVGVTPVNAPFGWPLNTKSTVTGFSGAVIRFDPRGSASVPGSQSLPESLQIALVPSKGGMVPMQTQDTAIVQIDAVNGIVKAFRPGS